jgi:hypothetical protein
VNNLTKPKQKPGNKAHKGALAGRANKFLSYTLGKSARDTINVKVNTKVYAEVPGRRVSCSFFSFFTALRHFRLLSYAAFCPRLFRCFPPQRA